MILTVFDEDVGHVLLEAVRHNVLVGLHHVGAEDLLVAALRHVGPGRPGVGFQQFGAAGLRRKQSQSVRAQEWQNCGVSRDVPSPSLPP